MNLTPADMASAGRLSFTTYGQAGYESAAQYLADFPIGADNALFAWEGMAGAVYTVQSTSYWDPATLQVFDQSGLPVAADDGSGIAGSDHLTFRAPNSGSFYVAPSWQQGSAEGQHGVTLSVYEDLRTLDGTNINGSTAAERLAGTADSDNIFGNGGADLLIGGGGDDYLDGGEAVDVAAYADRRGDFEVRSYGDRFLVVDLASIEGRDLLSNTERLAFSDMNVALDVDGAGGQAYRIYQAAFNRAPDRAGLGFWIYQLDHGASLEAIAGGFIDSAEFRKLYGAAPSNYDIAYRFYQNVLHREPDAGGLDFWVHVLDAGLATRAAVLVGFSESSENYVQLLGTVGNGMDYQPWAQGG